MYRTVRISDFLHRRKDAVRLESDAEYSLVTVKMHHKGVVEREKKQGVLINSNMYRISKGQFILSGIDARHGAFGIVPDDLDGAIITNDFWCFDVDESVIKRDFFYWLTNTPLFLDACVKSSRGVTQRIRLQKELFFDFEFHIPPLDDQGNFLKRIEKTNHELTLLDLELIKQIDYFAQLRQSILQEAIDGKLTAEWRECNPQLITERNCASRLLEEIRVEKDDLIKKGKIRKEDTLPSIIDDEKPFVLPDGWGWCRLGEICSKIGSGSTPRGSNYSTKGIPFFRSQNIHDKGLVYDDIKFISSEVHKKMNGTVVIANDLLLNITGGSLGRCALVPANFSEGNVSQHVCIIRPILVSSAFMHKVVLSPLFQNMVFASTTGAGREGLPKYNLKQFVVPIPSLPEQQAISERADGLMNMIDELERQVDDRKARAETLMQSILREAFA
jgi:type I restriction enzyme S subunit